MNKTSTVNEKKSNKMFVLNTINSLAWMKITTQTSNNLIKRCKCDIYLDVFHRYDRFLYQVLRITRERHSNGWYTLFCVKTSCDVGVIITYIDKKWKINVSNKPNKPIVISHSFSDVDRRNSITDLLRTSSASGIISDLSLF